MLQLINNIYNICKIIEDKFANVIEQSIANNNSEATTIASRMLAINLAKIDNNIEFIANKYNFLATFAIVDNCVFNKKKSKILL